MNFLKGKGKGERGKNAQLDWPSAITWVERTVKRAFLLAAVLATCLASAQQKYAQSTTTINAGIVIIDSDATSSNVPWNHTPHAWYNLDRNTSIKPAEWVIDNPNHPGEVTSAIASRWSDAILNPAGGVPSVGSPISKGDSPYWEAFIDNMTDEQIARYDVLLLSAHGYIQLNSIEREKLRRFMDKGGILWIDVNTSTSFSSGATQSNYDLVNNFPLPFKLGSGSAASPSADYGHPLLDYPNQLSFVDLAELPGLNPAAGIAYVTASDLGSIVGIEEPVANDSFKLACIQGVAQTDQVISVGSVGAGYEVITSTDISTSLNGGADHGYYSLSSSSGTGGTPGSGVAGTNAAAKFAVNLISLAAGYAEQGKGPRKVGGSAIDVGAPLLQEFNASNGATGFPPNGTQGYSPPTVFKGIIAITNGSNIYVYNANPSHSLAYDPLYGERDYNVNDLVWQGSVPGGAISSATCVEVPNTTNSALDRDQLWVVDSQGNLQEFNIFKHFSSSAAPLTGITPDLTIAPPNGPASFDNGTQPGPYAPTFQDGLLFVSDMQESSGTYEGRVWIANPTDGSVLTDNSTTFPFTAGGTGNGIVGESSGPATVGYIPIQDNSGGLDRVVYIPTAANAVASGPNATAGVTSIWLGVKGESEQPGNISIAGNSLTITTRAASQGLEIYQPTTTDTNPTLLALGTKITITDGNGNAESSTTMADIFGSAPPTPSQGSGGTLQYTLQDPSWFSTHTYGIRLDYTIDWGAQSGTTLTSQLTRGQFFLPDNPANSVHCRILDHLVLDPLGTLQLVTSTQQIGSADTAGGSYFAIQEQGRGSFTVLTRWDLYDQHTISLNGSTDANWGATLNNFDPVASASLFGLGQQLSMLTFTSAPSVSNGVVYCTAQGFAGATSNSSSQVPCTVLLAFKADPSVTEIRANDVGADATVLQPDLLRSSIKSAPDVFSVLQANQYTFEQQPGSDQGVFRINNLSSTNRGAILNCLSTSQPVVIRKNGAPDVLLEPDTTGSTWSPLLWYSVLTGVGFSGTPNTPIFAGPPFVSGGTVFIGAVSYLAGLQNTPPSLNQPIGLVFGISTQIAANDPSLITDTTRPWQKQLPEVLASGQVSISNLQPNPDFVWPQLTGVTNFSELATRMKQAELGASTQNYGVIGGDGMLFSWSDAGLFGFNRADFVVADSNRISDFDSSGNPIWSTDVSLSAGAQASFGSAANSSPVVNPSRAYPFGNGQVLAVDPGANRLAIIDQSGNEIRTIDHFVLNAGFTPDGYTAGEKTTFSSPRDAAVYSEYRASANNPFNNAAASEYWVHYVVADSGNYRLVELVDRFQYDPNTNQVGSPIELGDLFGHSPKALSGGRFSYSSVARAYDPDATVANYVIAAGIGNVTPITSANQVAFGAPRGNGGIVVFGLQAGYGSASLLAANNQVFNSFTLPSINTSNLFSPSAPPNAQSPAPELSGTFGGFASGAPSTVGGTTRAIGDLNSVTLREADLGTGPTLYMMFTDSTGVYEVPMPSAGASVLPSLNWMLPRAVPVPLSAAPQSPGTATYQEAPVYSVIRRSSANEPTTDDPLDFRPTYAERMGSGDVLVVNGYVGRYRKEVGEIPAPPSPDPDVPFSGEILVFEGHSGNAGAYDPTQVNLGFSSTSIKFELPPVEGARGLVLPVFAERR